MRYNNFTAEDEQRFLSLCERGLTAVFIYTNKLVHNGKRAVIDPADPKQRIIAYSGKLYAPVSFYSSFLGAECTKRCGRIALTLGDKRVSLKDDRAKGYLPMEKVLEGLCIPYKLLYEDSFLVMGCAEALLELCDDEALINAGPYALFGDYDTSSFTDEDYEAVAKSFHDKLVGTKETNDLTSPMVREKMQGINNRCRSALEGLDRSGDPAILWGEKLLRDTEDGARQYSYVRALATAYATYGSDYYMNKDVLDDVKYSLEWMYRHAYGEDMIAGNGWRDPKLPNWWYMYIGAPEHLAEILLMLYDEIGLEDRRRYLKCFEWIASWMCLGPSWRVTRIKICTEYGVLLHDPKYLIQEAEDFDASLVLKRPDYVDFTHTYPHNMSYGGIYLSRFMYIASVLAGSPLEYNSPNSYKQFFRVKYMYEPAMYKGQAFFMLSGRYTAQLNEAAKSADSMVHLLSMIGVFGEDEDAYIKQFLKRHSVHPDFRNTIVKSASFVDLAKYEQLLADDSVPYEYYYEYAHAWYTGDRAAQHRSNYAFGIAMCSKRHINYESILQENRNGWYTGDGAFHLYTSYDTHQNDGNNFMNNMNIAYRFPGTTEDMQPRIAHGIGFDPWKAPNSFAGSVEIDNKYIVAGLDFISEYHHGPDLQMYDEVRGYSRPLHNNDLVARKSWFCFDDEAILLGAGITSTMNSPVNTIPEHRRIAKDELGHILSVGGASEVLPKCEYEKRVKNPDFLVWEGHAAYVFLDETDLYLSRYNYTTNIEQPYMELRIEHGENPKGAKYAFAVLPYADEARAAEYKKTPDVTIVSNTSSIQAVRENKLNITGYVFYEGGACEYIEVDTGAIVTVKEEGGKLYLTVCDPTQEATEINLKLHRALALVSSDKRLSAENEGDLVKIKVNCEGSMSAPIRAEFKILK